MINKRKVIFVLPIFIFILLFLFYYFSKQKISKWGNGSRNYTESLNLTNPISKWEDAYRLFVRDSNVITINESKIKILNFESDKSIEINTENAYYSTTSKDTFIYLDNKKNLLFKLVKNNVVDSLKFIGADGELNLVNNDIFSYNYETNNDSLEFYLQDKNKKKLIDLSKIFYPELNKIISDCKSSLTESKICSNENNLVLVPMKIGFFVIYDFKTQDYKKVKTVDERDIILQNQLEFDAPGLGKGFKCEAIGQHEYIQSSACIQSNTLYILQDIVLGSEKEKAFYSIIDMYNLDKSNYVGSLKIKLKDKLNEILQIQCNKENLFFLMYNGEVIKLKHSSL